MAEDGIIILVSIARKLQHCNLSQLTTSVEQIIKIFKENKEIDALQSIILAGICKNYSKLKIETLQQIKEILPNEKELKINDSITKSQLTPPAKGNKNIIAKINNKTEPSEPLTFLKIPSDLKYYLFNYLGENDLYSLEKTCRSICIDARNPNSLYYISINTILNINDYTQNKRYNKIKYLNVYLHPSFPSTTSEYTKIETYKILPFINSFPEIHTIKASFGELVSEHQYKDWLNVFYNILINGSNNKTFIYRCESDMLPRIFDTNDNNLAKQALFNVKNINVFMNSSFQCYDSWMTRINNISSAVENEDHKFDLVEFTIDNIYVEEMQLFNWKLISNIKKHSQVFNMKNEITFCNGYCYDSNFWDNFVFQLANSHYKQYFDALSFKFVITNHEFNEVLNFEEHLNRWLQFDRDLMKKIGMTSIHIELEYKMFHETRGVVEYYRNNTRKILNHVKIWNKIHKSLKGSLEQFCQQNPSIEHGIQAENIKVMFHQEFVYAYNISYHLQY